MISRVLTAAVLAIGVTLVPWAPAQAVGASVTVANSAFSPKVVQVPVGGTVNVPVAASGTPGAGWTLKWSTVTGGGATSFDVQVRRPGSATWRPLKTDTTRATTKFNPARSGAYAVRARTTVGSGTSGWSPLKPLTIS